MIEPTTTRRDVLGSVVVALGVSIAGCSWSVATDSDDGWPAVEDPGETTEFEAFEIRSEDQRQFVFLYDEEADQYRERGEFLLTEDDVSDLRIESVSNADAAAARSFVGETDFEHESVLVQHHPVTADGTRKIRSVTIERKRVELEDCQPTANVYRWSQALFLRLPHPYPKRPTTSKSGRTPCGNLSGIVPERP